MTYKRQMAKPWRAPNAGICLLKRGLCTPVPCRETESRSFYQSPLLTQHQPLQNPSLGWGCPPTPAAQGSAVLG